MLYIKFNIQDPSKYTAFQKLYTHMVKIRQPDFEFEEEEAPQFDWDKMAQEEINEALEKLFEFNNQGKSEFKRYQKFIPDYANSFLEKYLGLDNEHLGSLGVLDTTSILNYLEYGFEVDMNDLEKQNAKQGIVKFSTGNYPFGGLERFFMVLKAFALLPIECYNGFTIYEFEWVSEFEYNSIEQPEKTRKYLKNFDN